MNIKELENLSPCPIKYVPFMIGGSGSFIVGRSIFKCKIEIRGSASEPEKLASLAHEIGHALCFSKKCKCMKDAHEPGEHLGYNAILAEYHAMKFCIKWLLKNKQKEALINEVSLLEREVKEIGSIAHSEAAKKIMKLKLWKKALKFIEEN